MKWLKAISGFLKDWTINVADAIISSFDRVVSPRVVRLVEQNDGGFSPEPDGKSAAVPTHIAFSDGALSAPNLAALFKGSRIEIVLQSKRFVFRPLEVPARAADFVEGIVRAQIDRLTPWSASEAVFGCSRPTKSGADSVSAVVAATTRKVAMTYVDAVSGFHPAAIAVLTDVTGYDVGRIKVFEQKARGYLDAARLSRMLLLIFAATGIFALASVAAAIWGADYLGDQEAELVQQIAHQRAAIRASSDANNRSPITALERRKQQTPASVVVLDALTKALPDNTYVTELHLAESKLQIVGISGDAPSLISLIEQSPQFAHATFYAPTTRTPSDPGDRFHIEAQVETRNPAKP